MKFQEYLPLAMRTAKRLETKAENLNHAVLGLLSEVNEMTDALETGDLVNLREELGDILWYIALAHKCLLSHVKDYEPNTDDFTDFTDYSKMVLAGEYGYLLSKLSDDVKRMLIYKKEYTDVDFERMASLLISLSDVVFKTIKAYNLDVDLVMQRNIVKLKERYKDQYTDWEATHRDLVKERNVLENG